MREWVAGVLEALSWSWTVPRLPVCSRQMRVPPKEKSMKHAPRRNLAQLPIKRGSHHLRGRRAPLAELELRVGGAARGDGLGVRYAPGGDARKGAGAAVLGEADDGVDCAAGGDVRAILGGVVGGADEADGGRAGGPGGGAVQELPGGGGGDVREDLGGGGGLGRG